MTCSGKIINLTYSGKLINDLIEAAERVREAWKKDNELRSDKSSDDQLEARLNLADAIGVLHARTDILQKQRCTPADEMASIREELRQPVYEEKPAFSDFQLKEHLYGSENSQG